LAADDCADRDGGGLCADGEWKYDRDGGEREERGVSAAAELGGGCAGDCGIKLRGGSGECYVYGFAGERGAGWDGDGFGDGADGGCDCRGSAWLGVAGLAGAGGVCISASGAGGDGALFVAGVWV